MYFVAPEDFQRNTIYSPDVLEMRLRMSAVQKLARLQGIIIGKQISAGQPV